MKTTSQLLKELMGVWFFKIEPGEYTFYRSLYFLGIIRKESEKYIYVESAAIPKPIEYNSFGEAKQRAISRFDQTRQALEDIRRIRRKVDTMEFNPLSGGD